MLYRNLIKPILFSLEPEVAHDIGAKALQITGSVKPITTCLRKLLQSNQHPIEVFGLTFPNLVGQAAGLDKNGVFPATSEALGFGFVEVGTVTPLPQPGNERPRLFRLPQDYALVNRMGFNNDGIHSLVEKIQRSFPKKKRSVPLGINLGKGKSTPLDLALEDYCKGFDVVAKQADYITINVSSPNTPNLRQLQNNEFLQPLLQGIKEYREKWSIDHSLKSPPCLLKISPDETFKNLEQIISKAVENKFDGIIASNTSIDSSCIQFAKSVPTGGISGKPLSARSDEVIRFISKLTNEKLPIIGSGGIFDYESAQKKLDSGACLLQIYTSFIYHGPLWPSKLARRIPLANSLI